MVEKIVNNAYEEAETLRYLLEKIIAKFNVRINLSDIAGIRKINNQIEDVFRQYSYHNNSFCNHIKKDEALHGLCIKSKNVLCKRIKRPFYGKCYLGIYELYYPVWYKDQLIALICIGQFSNGLEKSLEFVKRKAEKYGLDPAACAKEYASITKEINFSVDDLNGDAWVICNYMSLLYRNAILQRFIESKLSGSMRSAADYYQDKAIISSAVDFINKNYSQNISLDLISKNCYCNPAYLSYLFNKEMGMTITDYINKSKVEYAKRLLDLTDFSITQISQEVGFNDPSYFSKVFKKTQGASPTDYRERKN